MHVRKTTLKEYIQEHTYKNSNNIDTTNIK